MNVNISLNKLFTVNSIKRIITSNNLSSLKKLVEFTSSKKITDITGREAINELYQYLSKYHRNEYYYKNLLFNKILLGRHSINTTAAIRELPISGNRLDFLIINGVGKVYEIKTELDNLSRLRQQIESYFTAFSYCNVVTDQSHLKAIEDSVEFSQVGIILLTKQNHLHTVRPSKKFDKLLTHISMFKLLRKSEYENIILEYFGYLPDTNQFQYFDACLALFKTIDILTAQSLMMKQLKKRSMLKKTNRQLFNTVPTELKSLAYFANFKESDFKRMHYFLTNYL